MATYEITDSILKRHAAQMGDTQMGDSSVAGNVANAAANAASTAVNAAESAAGSAASAVSNAATEATDAAGAVADKATGSSPWKGIIYAVVAIVVVYLAMKLFGS
ncbi:MAG: hypothetical protein KTR33_06305 [Gammaproteobacteria bacterium]|nr:hypothetical protein [Gammaproteobacteria bacterium]